MESRHRSRFAVGSAAAFRPAAKQYALHPLEKALMLTVIAVLVYLPWALGGMRPGAQLVAGALAALAFVLSLVPRTYDDRYHAGGNLRLHMWPKLRRFPIFWLGLVYFAVILTQIFNPAWVLRTATIGWWLEPQEHITWLPHGVEGTPFSKMNGWRTLLIQGGAWLMVCALWVGITRRRTARLIATAVALNGLILAIVVILQRLTGTTKLLWLWDTPSTYFAASFFYKNHAGEFFCLILSLCAGLAWWHTDQAERHLAKSHPGMVWMVTVLLVVVAQMFTYARAATAMSITFLLIVILIAAVRFFFRDHGGTPPLVTALTLLLGVMLVVVALTQMNSVSVVKKFEMLFREDKIASVASRRTTTTATLEMAENSLMLGHGAGSFRYIFPQYQQHHPSIYKPWGKMLYWEYAHNDYAQLLAEMGLIGAGLALFALLTIIASAWQTNLFSQFALLLMLGGPALVAATAVLDFPLHNPAVLFTTMGVCVVTLRWAQLGRR